MYEFVESHVRRLVAEHLGVRGEDLLSGISLREDLAADSLDLVELAMALEAEFAIVVPERILDGVRTYGDLVHATGVLLRARCVAETRGAEPPSRIQTRIVSAAGESGGTFERTCWLTAYAAETIADDTMRAGRGARLDVTVAAGTTAGLARVRHQFSQLEERGVQVTVRHDERPALPPVHSTADRVAERCQVAAAGRDPALTHRLLDELTGAHTTVRVTDYVGDDPWQAEDLIACIDEEGKRFGDGTPTEQAQALSGSGPCHFVEADPAGGGYRATTEEHHVHAQFDQPAGDELIGKDPTRLVTGPGVAGSSRYFRTDLCTVVGVKGERLTSREATCYSKDREGRAFDVASSATRLAPAGASAGRQRGLRATFDLSAPSPNGFRPLTAVLHGAAEGSACTLLIQVSAQVAGTERVAQVTVRRGAESTMDVRLLPVAAAAARFVASP